MRAPSASLILATLALAASTTASDATAGGGRAFPIPEPVGTRPRESPTTLAVPLNADESVVFELPEGFWVETPRVNSLPTVLAGDGTIARYLNQRGGTVGKLYVGTVPFSEGEGPAATRAHHTALDFAATLPDHYAKDDWAIASGPVTVAPVAFKVGTEKSGTEKGGATKVAAWRSKRYTVKPSGPYGGPESVFTGECLLFHLPDTDRIVYAVHQFKAGGTTLDKAVERVSRKRTREVHGKARRVQLLEQTTPVDDPTRFPLRLVAFDMPAGFVVTPDVLRLTGIWTYAEDRLDAGGKRDAALRLYVQPADQTKPLTQDRDDAMAYWRPEDRGVAIEVPLATRGKTAWLFTHPSPADLKGTRAMTAVVRLDDLTLLLTWTTFGDALVQERDRHAFVAMLSTLEATKRW